MNLTASQELILASHHWLGNDGQILHGQVSQTGQAPAGDVGQTLHGQVSHTGQAPVEGVVVGREPSSNLKFVPGQAPVEGEVVGQEPVSNVESFPEIDSNVIYNSLFESILSVDVAKQTYLGDQVSHDQVSHTGQAPVGAAEQVSNFESAILSQFLKMPTLTTFALLSQILT